MNVILVVCDTLRADHLGCYGGALPTSPWMDRLAGEGTRFACVRSPHIPTQPAHTTLFSGSDVFAHGVVSHGGAYTPPTAVPWLPELLRGAGVFTAAADNIGRWMPRGFDLYEPFPLAPSPDGYWRKADATLTAVRRLVPGVRAAARAGRSTFTFVHFWDPHTPYCPEPPFDRLFYDGDPRRAGDHGLDALWAFEPFADYFRGWMPGVTDRDFPRAQYAACVRSLDHAVQRLFTLLGAAGLLEDALVVLTADHGEELGEHGIWFDHHGLYETNLRVPLILWGPGRIPRGLVCGGAATLLDLAPTMLAALGQPVPAGLAGRDLAAVWRGGDVGGAGGTQPMGDLGGASPSLAGGATERALASTLYASECTWMRKRAWYEGRFKLISALEPDFHGGPDVELYDLEVDPGETCNLAVVRAEVRAALLDHLEAHVARRVAETGRPDPLRAQPVTSRRIGAPGRGVAGLEAGDADALAGGSAVPGAAEPPAEGGERGRLARQTGVTEAERERVSQRLANLGY